MMCCSAQRIGRKTGIFVSIHTGIETISRYAEAARKDIFMCIATEKRSISLEFKTNRQPLPSFAAIACNI